MTLGELQGFVGIIVDDINFGYFKLNQVTLFLNNASKQVQKLLLQAGQNFYIKCVTTTMVINQAEYAVPDDFSKVMRFETYTGTVPNETITILEPITTMEDSLLDNKPGTPCAYWLKTRKFVLNQPPQTADVLRLYYAYQIGDMAASNDEPDVPERYHEMIGYYAIRDCFIKDGREISWVDKKIDEYKMQLKQDAQKRREDRSKMVSVTELDWYGYY